MSSTRTRTLFAVAFALATLVLSGRFIQTRAEDWGVPESFAVVNPVVRSEYADVLSLDGKWDFTTSNAFSFQLALGGGVWAAQSFPEGSATQLNVPGIWEAQGIGEPGQGRTWDCVWDCGHWDLNSRYVGSALYRTKVEIPERWNGKRVWLKIGGVASQARIWINRERAAFYETYCGARKYDVTDLVTPGETAEIVALVRNDVPARIGLYNVNERFGGFYRSVELEATPDVYVDDVWAITNLPKKTVEARVYVKGTNEQGKPYPQHIDELSPNEREHFSEPPLMGMARPTSIAGLEQLDVTLKTADGKIVASRQIKSPKTSPTSYVSRVGAFTVELPLDDCELWTPENPVLYNLEVVLRDKDGNAIHGWTQRYGARELKVVGRQFYLNGQPYFFRGGGDHNYDQINLIEPADRNRFLEHMSIYKTAGFNYMRFHTHSPLPEYFEAADEKGILLQPELPYYHDVPCEGFEFNPEREMWELFRTNRRYVSFATYSYGNEGYLGSPLDEKMYQWVKRFDRERLVIHQDGGPNNKPTVNCDFTTNRPNGSSFILPWNRGEMDPIEAPVIAHEYLNLSIKMDPRLESRFTGVRKAPVSADAWSKKLAAVGLNEDWGDACLAAAETLQGIYQKRGLESARLDPACDGYLYWSLVDASIPQGACVAAQGYLNPFWEPRKHGVQPEEFARFNGPTALLLDAELDSRALASGDSITVTFSISHFDANPIPRGTYTWELAAKDGSKTFASGTIDVQEIAPGYVGKLGDVEIKVPKGIQSGAAAELKITAPNDIAVNAWNFWILPERKLQSLKGYAVSPQLVDAFSKLYADVKSTDEAKEDDAWIVSTSDPQLSVALKLGKRILAITPASDAPNVSLGWWALGTQVGAAVANSEAFKEFPTGDYMDELWFNLVRTGAPDLAERPLGDGVDPLFVGEGRDSYYLYLGQTQFKDARILTSYALDLTQGVPESNALLDSLLLYIKSDAFQPKARTKSIDALKVTQPSDPNVVWGYDRIVSKPAGEDMPWLTLYEDDVCSPTCRQTSTDNAIVWKTVAPRASANGDMTTIQFVGALGYQSEPYVGGFQLLVDDKPFVEFSLPSEKDATEFEVGTNVEWKSSYVDGSLSFNVGRVTRPGPDYFGVFTINIPRKALAQPNEPIKLEVRALNEGSRRWFSVSEYRGLYERETLTDDSTNADKQ